MANLSKVIYINEEDYSTLINGGTITKGGVTYSHDPTALYVIKNVSAPEYAETAGYATTAGQATKATQDGGGNVISETYEKEQQVIIEFEISGNGIIFTNLEDSEVREICNDSSKTVLLMDVGNPGMDNECAVYYRSVFATDYWIFSSTSTMRGGGNIIVFYWDDNHEIINLRSSSDLFPTENVDFGQAYGISSNNANLAARTSSISEFELKKGGIVAIKFTTDIDITNPSLNISSTGPKPIYYRGSALSGGTVNAGDTVTFIYDGTYYHIISIDKDIPAPATTAPIMDGTAAIGTSSKYAKEDHVHPSDTSKQDKPIGFLGWSETYFNDWQDFPKDEANARELTSSEAAAIQDIHQNAWNKEWCFEFGRYPMTYSWNGEDANIWTVLMASGDTVGVMSWVLHYNSNNEYWLTKHQSEIATTDIFATVATSGSYNDLTNKPTIPSAVTVDSSLTGSSQTNPVQGGAIYSALDGKADKTFVINIEDNGNDGYTCDKTNAEIYAAWQAGREVICIEDGEWLYHLGCIPGQNSVCFVNTVYDELYAVCMITIRTNNNVQTVSSSYFYSQAQLKSGTNIKTINNQSLLGSGNLTASDVGAEDRQKVVVKITNISVNNVPTFVDANNNALTHAQVKDLLDNLLKDVIIYWTSNNLFYSLYYAESGDDEYYFSALSADDSYVYWINLTWDSSNNTFDFDNGNYTMQQLLVSGTNIKTINNQSLLGSGNLTASDIGALPSNTHIPNDIKVGSVAGKLYRNNVGGSGNFSISGNSGCIPNLTAGTFLVSIYAKSATQSYTFRFNFGSSVSYDLSTTNGEISDVRQITIPSNGTFSGSVLNSSVASGTILYVVMYNYLTPVSTVGVAAVTNQYSDLDGTPTITPVNNGTLTIQQNGITVGTFTANQSSNTTANIYSTMFGTLGQNGFERDNYNSTGGWAGVEIVTPDPLVTYIDILSNKLYRYDPPTSRYIELSEGDLSTITSTAITDLTDIL